MNKKVVFNGIQSSGTPHIGNVIGSILPSIELVKRNEADSYLYFIADLHSLTTEKNKSQREKNILELAAVFLALGLDIEKAILFRQSKISEVCELMWYLSCYTPYPMLANAHSFKDKSKNLADVNGGLFTYPVLMAADILLYDTTLLPVGRDQIQHVEIVRDIAKTFNKNHGNIFIIPSYIKNISSNTIVGTDGRKMSKSYKNVINIFLEKDDLKKQIMSIKTSSTPMGEKKDFENCNVFKIYKTIASVEKQKEMQEKYLSCSYGFADAKRDLLDLIYKKFEKERELYKKLMLDEDKIYDVLKSGEDKARVLAQKKINQVRNVLGF